MLSPPTYWDHLRAALGAALLLALCQVALGTLIIALRMQGYILSPQVFFGNQIYDFCVKCFMLLPGASSWLHGGNLDRFLPIGFLAKLPLGGAFVVPDVVVCLAFGVLVASARFALRRPATVRGAVWWLLAIGLAVHALSGAFAVYVPKAWNLKVLVRQAGRTFIWEGLYIALINLILAGAAALFLSRLRPPARFTAAAAIAAAIGVGVVMLPSIGAPPSDAAVAERQATAAGDAKVKNFILVSIDSLRADRLGSYGNRNETSPTLDRLAAGGIRFTNAMSTTSWTLPSHMSLLTGRYVLSHGVITEKDRLPEAIPTLAEQLQRAGIVTGGVVSVPLLGKQYGFGRGFDRYDDQTIPSATWFDALRDEPAPKVTELAEEWIRAHRQDRFFLFLHYWDVHYDYIPPEPYDRLFDPDYTGSVTGVEFFHDKSINRRLPRRDIDHLLALYDGEIRWVDDHLSKLVGLLGELGIEDDTAIVVTADHGDEFFEHGYKGHGRTLYREVTHVPLIVHLPDSDGGRVDDTPVSLVDIMPTILDLAGVGVPAGVEGASLRPLFGGGALPRRDAVYAWLCFLKRKTNCQAMQYSPVGTLIHEFQPLRLEFYTPDDRLQAHDVADSASWPREEQLDRLQRVLDDQWLSYRSAGGEQGDVDVDKATMERLRALGYVD